MDKTDIPGTFNAGATLGPVNETNMTRIWNKHKQSNTPLKRKVFVGLSGGVDSAVSAALLKRAGYKVNGVFIKVWQPDWIDCTWKEDRREAMRVAAHLDIPFTTLDLEKEYKEEVIDYMIAEYKGGRTPNPDVMCNRYVKFGAFWSWARERGADYVATGHYARVICQTSANNALDIDGSVLSLRQVLRSKCSRRIGLRDATKPVNVTYSLLTGIDTNKDQSYFLWTLNQHDLPHVMFPVGHLTKPEVRRLAKKFKLPNAGKKDSQGLCFIGKINFKEFLSHYIHTKTGDVQNERGEVIGKHPCALFFTIGERHGFTITVKTPNDSAYYVIDNDIEQNTITVSNKDIRNSLGNAKKSVRISHVNWISGTVPQFEEEKSERPGLSTKFPLQARSRYRQPLSNVRIVSVTFSETVLEFEKPQDTLTPGQSLVIYDGEECLGGGIIEE